MKNNVVLYHADCADGFAAAYVAYTALSCADNQNAFVGVRYDKNETLERVIDVINKASLGERVDTLYILDFSFTPSITLQLAELYTIVWLDHHKKAIDEFSQSSTDLDVASLTSKVGNTVVLDASSSGAMLTLRHFYPAGTAVSPLVRLVQLIDDRDRWQFRMPESKALNLALMAARPWTFSQWSFFTASHRVLDELTQSGSCMASYAEAQINAAVARARPCVIPGFGTGLHVNSTVSPSEIGDLLSTKSGTYALIWSYVDSKILCSFRSKEVDVNALAMTFGGGGHEHAAGCSVDLPTLQSWI